MAVTPDETVFIAGISSVEAIRDNQRVFELKPSYAPTAIGAGGNVVAVGGEVSICILRISLINSSFLRTNACMSTLGTAMN